MFLCVSGDVTPEEVMAVADKMLPKAEEKKIERFYDREGREPVEKYVEAKFEIAKPMFLLGLKDGFFSQNARENHKRTLTMQIVTETLFGYSSEFAVDVYESGLIDELDADYSTVGEAGSFFMFGGESDDVDAAIAKFTEYMEDVKKNGLDAESFERARRLKYASFVRSFEGTGIAETFSMSLIKGCDWFDTGDILGEITLEEANALVRELFDKKYYAVSVINPIEKEAE
jgi:predicted Zn-dependent peptidase